MGYEGGSYRLWLFNPKSDDPLTGPVRVGPMPEGFKSNILTGVHGLRPIDPARKDVPGTIDFMRTKIKHVVYYMIENCSFDEVCGWLYERGEESVNFVGRGGPFQGADPTMFNFDLDAKNGPEKVYLKKWPGHVQRWQGGIPENRPVSRYDGHDPPVLLRR